MPFLKIPRLSIYLMQVWLRSFVGLCLLVASLIFIITLAEIMRRTTGIAEIDFPQKAWKTLQQIPFIMEKIFPILCLLTTLATGLRLNKSSELVVIQAAGWSVWKVGFVWANITGLVAFLWILIINPLGVYGMRSYDAWKENYFHKNTRFLEQLYQNDQRIILSSKNHQKSTFDTVQIYFFQKTHILEKIIQAKKASYDLKSKTLILYKGIETTYDSKQLDLHHFASQNMFLPELKQFLETKSQNDSLYHLYEYRSLLQRDQVNQIENKSLYAQYYHLWMMPFLCMLLTGFCVALMPKFERGHRLYLTLFMILLAGAGLFVMDIILQSLASSGLIPAFLSAILIKICGFAFSLWFLLSKEYKGL